MLPFRRVAAATNSWTNHVGIVVDTSGDQPQIAESTFPLSRITPLSRFAARSAELQNLQKQIKDIQAKLQSSQQVLSEGENGRLQREGERLTGTLQRKQQYFQEDLNGAQQDMMNNIGPKLAEVLSKYSKENGYSVILDTSSQQTPVVYGAPQVDVTEEITKLYDQSHPAKSTPTTTPKATPRPTKP